VINPKEGTKLKKFPPTPATSNSKPTESALIGHGTVRAVARGDPRPQTPSTMPTVGKSGGKREVLEKREETHSKA